MFLLCKALHKATECHGTRIRNGIYGMTHAIDQTTTVKCLLMKDLLKVCTYLILILGIADMLLNVVHHLNNLDIGSAMLWSLQGRKSGCNNRVGVGACRGNYSCRKCGVVAATMLHMKHQSHIEYLCLQIRILLIRTQHS